MRWADNIITALVFIGILVATDGNWLLLVLVGLYGVWSFAFGLSRNRGKR